ncbi:MAG: LptA/OstA family protein [Methyloceanibacter sp.]|nr:LptA/OstA family protein [Methyloceanibacter sp.]
MRVVSAACLVLAVASAGILLIEPASAQEVKDAFKGLSKNSDKPIDIFSDTLTVYDERKLAVFRGNVRASQGTSTLQAAQLDVHYVGGAKTFAGGPEQRQAETQRQPNATSSAGPDSQIKMIEARGNVVVSGEDNQTTTADTLVYDVPAQKVTVRGNVVINAQEDQTTTSDWAIYDVAGQKAVVGGNVVLSQGQNVLKGDRLNIDLATGESRFENTGGAQDGSRRIRALLLPKAEKDKPAKDQNRQ